MVPLVAQAALNGFVPLLTFVLARHWCGRRTATLAALLTAVLSFNTIYASTESSDAVCTVIFLSAIAAFIRGNRDGGLGWFALAGVLTGLAMQFRPNLVLAPLLLGGYSLWTLRSRRAVVHATILLVSAGVVLAPWIVRNYRLTGMLLPTSVHGGVQLWYGTLQVGPALHSRAANSRSIFEAPAFEYTSLDHVPIIVEGQLNCTDAPEGATLAYWFDRDHTERRVSPTRANAGHFTFEIPPPNGAAVIYYFFETRWSGAATPPVRTTPAAGARAPFVYFVSGDHLGDLDVHGDLLDVFDVVRLLRQTAWNEPVPEGSRIAAVGVTDPRSAVAALLPPPNDSFAATADVQAEPRSVRMTFADGSSLVVPRQWQGRITDLTFTEGVASLLMTSRRSLRAMEPAQRQPASPTDVCTQFADVAVNQVFYRREPHMMQRYAALAFDNIQRDPAGFALASLYRAGRLFLIQGTSDRSTAQQFSGSGPIYAAATVFSGGYVMLFAAGVIIAWRRRYAIGLPLLLIAYIPATLAPVLTNMRYTVTVQPLMFVFMAVAIAAMLGIDLRGGQAPGPRALHHVP